MPLPWDASAELLKYLMVRDAVPASIRLSLAEELEILESPIGLSLGDAYVVHNVRVLNTALLNGASSETGLRVALRLPAVKRAQLVVDDDGPGVPEDAWEKVFAPFLRLDDSRTSASGGHGLGLSIVRRITYWHGGRSQIGHSDLGGARFSLVWPRKRVK